MSYVIIRPLELGDEKQVSQLLCGVVFEPLWKHWLYLYCSELAIQITVVTAAILFIIISLPLSACWISLPGVAFLFLFLTYSNYLAVLKTKKKELQNLVETYLEDQKCGFWVAEAWEEIGNGTQRQERTVEILRGDLNRTETMKLMVTRGLIDRYRRLGVIGTIGIGLKQDNDMKEPPRTVGTLTNFAVSKSFRRKGIGQELVSHAWQHCRGQLRAVEVSVMEHQQEARRFIESQQWEIVSVTEERLVPIVNQRKLVFRKACIGGDQR